MTPFKCFATAPRGFESLLTDELTELGASEVQTVRSGVAFQGTLEAVYRACLWSRIGGRILLNVDSFPATTPEDLYQGIQNIQWGDHLSHEGTLAVDCTAIQSELSHTRFVALKTKDAIVDQFREAYGSRPSVDTERPDLQINIHVFRNHATVSLDMSGESLHRRHYRSDPMRTPLKENLAASLLLRSRWPEIAAEGGALLDPMCGSGTLPIEAGLIAADIAPGLLRPHFGFLGWRKHDAELWEALLNEAHQRRDVGLSSVPPIIGYDIDPNAVTAALSHVENAGLHGHIHIEKRDVRMASPHSGLRNGLLITNPPYGKRMGQDLIALYTDLGEQLRNEFAGWRAAIFTGNPALAPHLQLKPRRSYELRNGAIDCKLLVYRLASDPSVYSRKEDSANAGNSNRRASSRNRR